MNENKYVVFLDKPKTTEIKIHNIECTHYQNYLKKHGTIHTKWNPDPNLDSAEETARRFSREYDNLEWRYAQCGGKCFSKGFIR